MRNSLILKRAALVILGPLFVIGMLELGLRLFGVMAPKTFYARVGDHLEINSSSPWGPLSFEPSSMSRRTKDDGTIRVFCLGASTVHGAPFGQHSSFSKWMRQRLERIHDSLRFEVIKMGHNGKTAEDIAELLEEVVNYDPDFVVVYTGHNEFLIENLSRLEEGKTSRLRQSILHLRLGRLLASMWKKPEADSDSVLKVKNPTRGLSDHAYLSEPQMKKGLELYHQAIESISETCRDRSVPLILCVPASNLSDYAPRVSVMSPHLDQTQRTKLKTDLERGRALLDQGNHTLSLEALDDALSLDSGPAILHYFRGAALQKLGRIEDARNAFRSARDLDNHPSRMVSAQAEMIRSLGGNGVYIAECEPIFAEKSRSNLPDSQFFVDNCHPDLFGQNLIADAILYSMASNGLIAPQSEWDFEKEPSPEEYMAEFNLDLTPIADQAATDVVMNLLMGDMHSIERLQRATFLLNFAETYDPENPRVQFARGLVAILNDDREAAKSCLEKSLSQEPSLLTNFSSLRDAKPNCAELLRLIDSTMKCP